MTDIDSLPAGPELDRLVAEAMGWRRGRCECCNDHFIWHPPNERRWHHTFVPRYSTIPLDNAEVERWLVERLHRLHTMSDGDGHLPSAVAIFPDMGCITVTISADEEPDPVRRRCLAFCRLALKVKEAAE